MARRGKRGMAWHQQAMAASTVPTFARLLTYTSHCASLLRVTMTSSRRTLSFARPLPRRCRHMPCSPLGTHYRVYRTCAKRRRVRMLPAFATLLRGDLNRCRLCHVTSSWRAGLPPTCGVTTSMPRASVTRRACFKHSPHRLRKMP